MPTAKDPPRTSNKETVGNISQGLINFGTPPDLKVQRNSIWVLFSWIYFQHATGYSTGRSNSYLESGEREREREREGERGRELHYINIMSWRGHLDRVI